MVLFYTSTFNMIAHTFKYMYIFTMYPCYLSVIIIDAEIAFTRYIFFYPGTCRLQSTRTQTINLRRQPRERGRGMGGTEVKLKRLSPPPHTHTHPLLILFLQFLNFNKWKLQCKYLGANTCKINTCNWRKLIMIISFHLFPWLLY